MKYIYNGVYLPLFMELILISIVHQGKQLLVLLLLFWMKVDLQSHESSWYSLWSSKTKGKRTRLDLVNRDTMLYCTTNGSSLVNGNR